VAATIDIGRDWDQRSSVIVLSAPMMAVERSFQEVNICPARPGPGPDRAADVHTWEICDLPGRGLLDAAAETYLLVVGARGLAGSEVCCSARSAWPAAGRRRPKSGAAG